MKKLFLTSLVLGMSLLASAKIVYVATDGNNAKDGSSWENAVADISKAYSLSAAGDQIWIAGGTYDLSLIGTTVQMVDHVDVYGSLPKGAANLSARVQPNSTKPWVFQDQTVFIASSAMDYRPFDRSDKAFDSQWKAVFDGIRFYKCSSTNGGKFMYVNTGQTIRNCQMDSCNINAGSDNTLIYMERDGLVENCYFKNNYGNSTSVVKFRGLYPNGSQPSFIEKGNTIRNCVFEGNSNSNNMLIYNTDGNTDKESMSIVENCRFFKNTGNFSINEKGKRITLVNNCVIDSSEMATEAADRYYAASALDVTGEHVYLNRCIISNCKNTAAKEASDKNVVIACGSTMSNCLITGLESEHAAIVVTKFIVNSTITGNGKGDILLDGTGGLINTLVWGNVDNRVTVLTETNYLQYSAFQKQEEVINYKNAISDGNVFITEDPFENAAEGNYYLKATALINAGGVDDYVKGGGNLVEDIQEWFALDLDGNKRFGDDDKINIGCYQTKNVSGWKDIKHATKAQKVMTEGQLFILHNGKQYNALGIEL